MAIPTLTLDADLESVRSAWEGALPAFAAGFGGGGNGTDVEADVEVMSGSGLLGVQAALAQARRDLDVLEVRVAAGIAARSTPELGSDGLAREQGYRSAAGLIAATIGGTTVEAARFISVGAATATRQSFTGDRLPARHPAVRAALTAGRLSVEAAAAITAMLDRVAPRADPADSSTTEATLVRRADTLSLEQLHRLVAHAEAHLDTGGVAPREEELRAAQSLRIRQEASGMLRFTARLDPENGAYLKTAIETLVTAEIRATSRTDTAAVGGPSSSLPSIAMLQADAMVAIARHALSCRETIAPLDLATVVVRIDLDDLTSGVGAGFIDGIDHPVSAGTVRRMSANAGIIPVVLGGDSEVLDLGRTRRLFSIPQRIALGERDGGCAFCGSSAAWAEAHHIRWWERDTGPTDLANGVLLCRRDHHRIHTEGWTISPDHGQVWFIPPPHVDPDRTPRLGGRARFG